MTLNGGIKCTDVSAILPSSGWHEEIICFPRQARFVVLFAFRNLVLTLRQSLQTALLEICDFFNYFFCVENQ